MARSDDRKTYVEEQLLSRKLESNAANRKLLRDEYDKKFPVGQGSDEPVLDPTRVNEMVAKAKELYPEFAFFFEDDAAGFGAEIKDLLIKAALNDYELPKFKAAYANTKYFIDTSKSIRDWNASTPASKKTNVDLTRAFIQDNYGDLVTDSAVLDEIATGATRLGLKDTQLRNYVFSVASTKPAKTNIFESSEAERIKQIARDYGYNLSQGELNSVLTGSVESGATVALTEQQLRERAKLSLLGEMPHLKTQIDAGLTLNNIFKNYQSVAAEELELDPNSVSVLDSKFRNALSKKDNSGQVRQLSLSEWRDELRTNDVYGYRYTKKANQDATDIGLSIARAFGKVG